MTKRVLLTFLLILQCKVEAATFTEFYCDYAVGTNVNSGSTTNASAVYSSVNGNWDGTSIYTPTDGSTPASTVSAGMWASIYVDGSTNLVQASAGGCIMLITNVAAGANGAITFDRATVSGTSPSSSATARSVNVGGAWNGPYGSIGFPFGFISTNSINSANVYPRVNFKKTSTYNVTSAMSHSLNGPIWFQGFANAPGDFGKATFDGGAGTGFAMLTISGSDIILCDLILQNNGGSSTSHMLTQSGHYNVFQRVICHDSRSSGFFASVTALYIECEAYACNKSSSVNVGGFNTTGGPWSFLYLRCYSHDNTGSTGHGFYFDGGGAMLVNCISANNGGDGMQTTKDGIRILNSDFYNNSLSGIRLQSSSSETTYIENSNFIKNGAWGITNSVAIRSGSIVNCGFGSGSQSNASGDIARPGAMIEIGNITYTANTTPWNDPGNGDFRITSSQSKSAGTGLFTQSSVFSPTNTVGFPDIGAAQSTNSSSPTSVEHSYTFGQ